MAQYKPSPSELKVLALGKAVEFHAGIGSDPGRVTLSAKLFLEFLQDEKRQFNLYIYRDDKGQWRWRARAQNNRVLADSAEGYGERQGVEHALELLFGPNFDLFTTELAPGGEA